MQDIINLDIKCRICEQMFAKDLKLDMHNKKNINQFKFLTGKIEKRILSYTFRCVEFKVLHFCWDIRDT